VFHAARQDIEIVVHQSGTIPHPIFDTQVARDGGSAMATASPMTSSSSASPGPPAGTRPTVSTDWSRRAALRRTAALRGSPTSPICATCLQALDADLKKRGRNRLGQRGDGGFDLAPGPTISTPSAPGNG